MNEDIRALTEEVKEAGAFARQIVSEVSKVVIGQKHMVEKLMIGLIADGHILLEGVPGLAKTLVIRSLACAVSGEFSRIQFTPDLLPADLIGTLIYDQKSGGFTTRKGPVFANFVLADEINRAPAKVQSALLESMQERQVTIGGETHKLPDPFLVLATQNPIEQEGTYPLPEAQVDRFMMKVKVGYPTRDEEKMIIALHGKRTSPETSVVASLEDIKKARELVDRVYVDEKLIDYVVDIVNATRNPAAYNVDAVSLVSFGASPRASLWMIRAARALAFLRGRGYVTPEDIRIVGMDVLRHRVMVSYEAEAEELTSEDVIQRVFDAIEIP